MSGAATPAGHPSPAARATGPTPRAGARPTLTACLNGARLPHEHPALPVTPAQIAAAARAAVSAGADDVHVHAKDADGVDTLDPAAVGEVMAALREAVPGVVVSLTTGAWAGGGDRVDAVAAWPLLPDRASVNWHEEGAVELAEALLARGVGVEAGLWTPAAVAAWRAWPRRAETERVLLEVTVASADGGSAVAAELLSALAGDTPSGGVQLHGEGGSTWAVFAEAVRRGLSTRIGLEDTLTRPDGTFAQDNQDLLSSALRELGD